MPRSRWWIKAHRRSGLAVVQRLLQGVEHEVGPHRAAHAPAHDAPGEHVDHERHVDEALPGRDVGEVADPQLVGPFGLELPIDPVQRARRLGVRHGGAHDLASHARPAGLARRISRSTVQRATVNAFAAQLPPDLVGSVDLHVGLPDALEPAAQDCIALGPRAAATPDRVDVPRGASSPTGRPATPCRSARPRNAPRCCVDESPHDLNRRSSSAWAKNALASFRISLALRSSRTSRSSSLMRCCSAVVEPARWPVSTSCWRTQRRSVSARAADLGGDRLDGRPLRRVLAAVLQHHAYRALHNLGGKLRGLPHGSILNRRSLLKSRGGSEICERIEQALGFRPNQLSLNYYADGNASMGFH